MRKQAALFPRAIGILAENSWGKGARRRLLALHQRSSKDTIQIRDVLCNQRSTIQTKSLALQPYDPTIELDSAW
jgi:hypothetical protein